MSGGNGMGYETGSGCGLYLLLLIVGAIVLAVVLL